MFFNVDSSSAWNSQHVTGYVQKWRDNVMRSWTLSNEKMYNFTFQKSGDLQMLTSKKLDSPTLSYCWPEAPVLTFGQTFFEHVATFRLVIAAFVNILHIVRIPLKLWLYVSFYPPLCFTVQAVVGFRLVSQLEHVKTCQLWVLPAGFILS